MCVSESVDISFCDVHSAPDPVPGTSSPRTWEFSRLQVQLARVFRPAGSPLNFWNGRGSDGGAGGLLC